MPTLLKGDAMVRLGKIAAQTLQRTKILKEIFFIQFIKLTYIIKICDFYMHFSYVPLIIFKERYVNLID